MESNCGERLVVTSFDQSSCFDHCQPFLDTRTTNCSIGYYSKRRNKDPYLIRIQWQRCVTRHSFLMTKKQQFSKPRNHLLILTRPIAELHVIEKGCIKMKKCHQREWKSSSTRSQLIFGSITGPLLKGDSARKSKDGRST